MVLRISTALVVLLFSLAVRGVCSGVKSWTVRSPNGALAGVVEVDTQERLALRIELGGREALPPSPLGLTMESEAGDFTRGLSFAGKSEARIDETYPMPSGKRSLHVNRAREVTLDFRNPAGRAMQLTVRAYDDGVAYRYTFPGSGESTILSEVSAFRFPAGTVGWYQKYVAHYENLYVRRDQTSAEPGEICLPALFRTPAEIWVLITEAAVYGDYAGARLKGSLGGERSFRFALPGPVSSRLPWTTPWRLAIVGRTLAPIVESVLVDNLNPPSEVADLSWIKPGRSTFPWWSDHAANSKPDRLRKFADFAADMGWEWLEFDTALAYEGGTGEARTGWLELSPWIPDFTAYARRKGIRLYGWDDWKHLDTPEEREREFARYKTLGFDGVKIDYMDSDTQATFRWYDDTIRDALRHRLMLSFHGATIPRGQPRRWPHVMTWEAVHGAEYYTLNADHPTPSHNCILPFTRNAIGPMDYTPVTFSVPGRKTTDAHELALAVIFESGWHNLSDSPESFAGHPGTPFLREVHAAWDETRFVDGFPGEYVVLARRKGADWFLAGINADAPRTVSLQLDFLAPGKYPVRLYRNDQRARGVAVEDAVVDSSRPLSLDMPSNGGFCLRLAAAARQTLSAR